MKKWIGIALGSNFNSKDISGTQLIEFTPESRVRWAFDRLRVLFPGVFFQSDIIETPPLGPQDQPNFFNSACICQSEKPPEELLRILKGLEVIAGRRKRRHWGERELDLDLIFVEGETRWTEQLKLPHPQAKFRKFVMNPIEDCFSQCQIQQISLKISDMLP